MYIKLLYSNGKYTMKLYTIYNYKYMYRILIIIIICSPASHAGHYQLNLMNVW